jgi:hypothetical protein
LLKVDQCKGEDSADEKEVNMYVGHKYFNKLYAEMKRDQDNRFEKVLHVSDDVMAKCNRFVEFGQKEFPLLRADASKAKEESIRVNQCM